MKIQISSMSGAERALAAGGMGALAAMLGAPQVEAAVVVSNGGVGVATLTNTTQTGTVAGAFMYMDPNTTNNVDVAIGAMGPSFAITMRYGLSLAVATAGNAQRFTATSLIAGHTAWMGPNTGAPVFNTTGMGWKTVAFSVPISWQHGTGYIGLRIVDGGGYDYSWILVTPNTLGSTLTINDWSTAAGGGGGGGVAGGGPGGAAGTPEPAAAGLGLLALGAAGVMRHKRRRKDKVA